VEEGEVSPTGVVIEGLSSLEEGKLPSTISCLSRAPSYHFLLVKGRIGGQHNSGTH